MRMVNELTRDELIKVVKYNVGFIWDKFGYPEAEHVEDFVRFAKEEGEDFVLQDNGKIRMDILDSEEDEWFEGDDLCPYCDGETSYLLTGKRLLNYELEIECEHCGEKIMACDVCRTVFCGNGIGCC